MSMQESCAAMIKQVHDALEKQANNAMRPQGMTMAQFGVLMLLREAPDRQLPLKELERRLHVAQSTAAGLIVRLEQKKMVESFGDPADRRIKMVRMTPAGLACCREADVNMLNAETMILSGLTDTEREIFTSLLTKVRDSIR